MKQRIHYILLALILVLTLLLQPGDLFQRTSLASQRESNLYPEAGTSAHLPLIRVPPGPPDFSIIAPQDGWQVSSTNVFAIQPFVTASVSRVTFSAGDTQLAVDDTPEDGFVTFLDADSFPAGELTLTAVAEGPTGETSQSATVTVVPEPASSGTFGPDGGVLATETGSTITIPPGSVPEGTDVSVDERTQDESTAANGIAWEELGVTFLGEQVIDSTAPISQPLRVSSAGYGNRVQPGQAVLNYTVLPDSNGDGVAELVALNTARVAPNDDVVTDPVPQILLQRATARVGERVQVSPSRPFAIGGPPGTRIELEASGLNPSSMSGNLAIWTSEVDGTSFTVPGAILGGQEDLTEQRFLTIIPTLPAGPAQLELRNEGTGASAGPISVTVETPPPLSRPAADIIDDALALTLEQMQAMVDISESDDELSYISPTAERGIVETEALRTMIQDAAVNPDPEMAQYLENVAVLIENSGLLSTVAPLQEADPCDAVKLVRSVSSSMSTVLSVGSKVATRIPHPAVQSVGVQAKAAGTAVDAVKYLSIVVDVKYCGGELLPCPTSPKYPPDRPLGMGGVPPEGGTGCGNLLLDTLLQQQTRDQSPATVEAGRVTVRLLTNNVPIAFTGANNAAGYFYLPIISEGVAYTAVAVDNETGAVRTASGTGPPIGESNHLFFDFLTEPDEPTSQIQYGDTLTSTIAISTEIDVYPFSGTAGQSVLARMARGAAAPDLDVRVNVYRPDGSLLCFSSSALSGLVEARCLLETDGTHYLAAKDVQGDDTGPYGLLLQRLDAPVGAQAIDLAQTATGVITRGVALDAYTLPATAGDRFVLRLVGSDGTLNPQWRVFDAESNLLCEASAFLPLADALCPLPETATYTVMVGDHVPTGSGDYEFYVQRLNDPVDPSLLQIGDTITGTITPAAELDTYTFDGVSGDQVLVRAARSGAALGPDFRVFRPDGTLLCDDGTSASLAEDTCALDVDGRYTVLLGDIVGTDTGDYGLHLQYTNRPTTAASLNYGDTITATLQPAVETDAYTFTGSSGDDVQIRMERLGGSLDPEFRLYRPDGSLLCDERSSTSVAEATCTLDVNGAYLILVDDYGGTDAADYTLAVNKTN